MFDLRVDDTFVKQQKEILFYIVNFNKYHLAENKEKEYFSNYDDTKLDWKFNESIHKYLENYIPDMIEYFSEYPKVVKEIETYNIIKSIKSSLRFLFKDYENYRRYCETQNSDKSCNILYINQSIYDFINAINYNYSDIVESNSLYVKRIPFIKEIYDSITIKIHFTIDSVEVTGIFNNDFNLALREWIYVILTKLKENKIDFNNICINEVSFYKYSITHNETFMEDLKKYQDDYLTNNIAELYDKC